MEEIMIHKNQTNIEDFLEDLNDSDIFKCKKCRWCGSSKQVEFVCLNGATDFYKQDVKRVKGCEYFYNDKEIEVHEDEATESLF